MGAGPTGASPTTGSPAGLTDTSILVDYGRGVPDAATFLNNQRRAGGVHISIISAMEMVEGCKNKTDLARLQRSLRALTVFPITEDISTAAYNLMLSLFLSDSLYLEDALIAATALAHGTTLYTHNIKHFRKIPGLTIARPY